MLGTMYTKSNKTKCFNGYLRTVIQGIIMLITVLNKAFFFGLDLSNHFGPPPPQKKEKILVIFKKKFLVF